MEFATIGLGGFEGSVAFDRGTVKLPGWGSGYLVGANETLVHYPAVTIVRGE